MVMGSPRWPGGWVVTCAPSRFNDPELAAVLPGWGQPLTFDAENAAAQVGGIFQVTSTIRWDEPLIQLADRGDVRRYPAGPRAAARPDRRGRRAGAHSRVADQAGRADLGAQASGRGWLTGRGG
jgi:hypothetical protein